MPMSAQGCISEFEPKAARGVHRRSEAPNKLVAVQNVQLAEMRPLLAIDELVAELFQLQD